MNNFHLGIEISTTPLATHYSPLSIPHPTYSLKFSSGKLPCFLFGYFYEHCRGFDSMAAEAFKNLLA
jgi:hypothetical protein